MELIERQERRRAEDEEGVGMEHVERQERRRAADDDGIDEDGILTLDGLHKQERFAHYRQREVDNDRLELDMLGQPDAIKRQMRIDFDKLQVGIIAGLVEVHQTRLTEENRALREWRAVDEKDEESARGRISGPITDRYLADKPAAVVGEHAGNRLVFSRVGRAPKTTIPVTGHVASTVYDATASSNSRQVEVFQARGGVAARKCSELASRLDALEAEQLELLEREGLTITADHLPGYARPTGPAHHCEIGLLSVPPFKSLDEPAAVAAAAYNPTAHETYVPEGPEAHGLLAAAAGGAGSGAEAQLGRLGSLKCRWCGLTGHLSPECTQRAAAAAGGPVGGTAELWDENLELSQAVATLRTTKLRLERELAVELAAREATAEYLTARKPMVTAKGEMEVLWVENQAISGETAGLRERKLELERELESELVPVPKPAQSGFGICGSRRSSGGSDDG